MEELILDVDVPHLPPHEPSIPSIYLDSWDWQWPTGYSIMPERLVVISLSKEDYNPDEAWMRFIELCYYRGLCWYDKQIYWDMTKWFIRTQPI